jgi:flavin-dependent dehydrogenase
MKRAHTEETTSQAGPAAGALPVIIGAGITGMAISARLSQAKIHHVVVGTPPPNRAPKLGESMEMLSSILLDEMFPDLHEHFVSKRAIFFYTHKAVMGANLNLARSLHPRVDIVSIGGVSAFLLGLVGYRRPRLGAIHVDRLGFDEALERKVRASEYCQLAGTRVAQVVYDADADRIAKLQLEDGRELEPSYVFDASNQARVVPNAIGIECRPLSAGSQRVTFAHYRATAESRTPAAIAAHKHWIASSNLVRLFDPIDGVHGVGWCIPIDDYVSMGISRPADRDLSDEDALAQLERSMADRGIRYRSVYPELAGTQSIEARFYVHDRVCGGNWILAGQTACQGWFSTLTGVESSLFCASIADQLLESPERASRAYRQYNAAVVKTHQGFSPFHLSTVDTPLAEVERRYHYTFVTNLYGRLTYQAQVCNGLIASLFAPFERFFLKTWIWLGKLVAKDRFCPLVVAEPEEFPRLVAHARELGQAEVAPTDEARPAGAAPASPLVERVRAAIAAKGDLLASVPLAQTLTIRIDSLAIGGLAAWHALVRRGEPHIAAVQLIPEKVEDQGGGALRVYARFHGLVDGKDRSSPLAVFDCVAGDDGLESMSTARHHLTFLLGDNARYRILVAFTRLSLALGARSRPRALEASGS